MAAWRANFSGKVDFVVWHIACAYLLSAPLIDMLKK